jgi:hydrogenase-4 component F
MGILTLGLGLGGLGGYGMGLHSLAHSFTKACLFLTAGTVLMYYRSKRVADIRGLRKVSGLLGILWIAGFLSIVGSPPFGTFLSELTILKSALDQGRYWVAGIYLALLGVIFVGMSALVLPMTQGDPPDTIQPHKEAGAWMMLPPAILCGLALMLGLYIPPQLDAVLRELADTLGAKS